MYIVCVGYLVGGISGAIAGFLALITPAFLVVPLMRWLGKHSDLPHVRGAIRGLMLASAGLLLSSSAPLAKDAVTGGFAVVVVIASFGVLAFTKVSSLWVIFGAALAGFVAKLAG